MQYKQCGKCKETKALDEFHRWSMSKDGHADWCKPCKSAHGKSPAGKATARRTYQKHRDKRLAENKTWQQNNRERYRERMAAAQRRAYARNPEKFKNKQHMRRLAKLEGFRYSNGVESDEWDYRIEEFNFACAYCLKPIFGSHIEQDHMQPLSLGGEHAIENLVPACRSCNAAKSNRSLLSFLAYQNGIMLTPVVRKAAA